MHIPGWMMGRDIEGLKVIVVLLDVGSFGNRETKVFNLTALCQERLDAMEFDSVGRGFLY